MDSSPGEKDCGLRKMKGGLVKLGSWAETPSCVRVEGKHKELVAQRESGSDPCGQWLRVSAVFPLEAVQSPLVGVPCHSQNSSTSTSTSSRLADSTPLYTSFMRCQDCVWCCLGPARGEGDPEREGVTVQQPPSQGRLFSLTFLFKICLCAFLHLSSSFHRPGRFYF